MQDFAAIWNDSASPADAARRLGIKTRSAIAQASRLRARGIELRTFAGRAGRRRKPVTTEPRNLSEAVGVVLDEHMRSLELTINDVAVRAGVSYPTVASVRRGSDADCYGPRLSVLDAIARAIGLRASVLVGMAERKLP